MSKSMTLPPYGNTVLWVLSSQSPGVYRKSRSWHGMGQNYPLAESWGAPLIFVAQRQPIHGPGSNPSYLAQQTTQFWMYFLRHLLLKIV